MDFGYLCGFISRCLCGDKQIITSMSKQINKVSFANLVIALGIIYGDIGTSPLYVLNAIIHRG